MFKEIKQFVLEKIKWIQAGKPYRSLERIEEIFNICNGCTEYKPQNEREGSCGICGCRLTRLKENLSKNSWATTRCPLEEPKWIEEVEPTLIQQADIPVEPEPTPPAPSSGGCGCRG